jgi:hypothetical protein
MSAKRGNPRGSDSSSSLFARKGQVTVFIIIGIIILFVFAAVLFVSKLVVKQPLLASSEPIISNVPQAFAPLQVYTHACVAQVGKQGLRRLGEQGGFIFPELVGEFSATKPTDADGLLLGSTRVPYWHYNNEPNSGGTVNFASNKPDLVGDDELSIQSQLERYVDEKLNDCLHSYVVFTEQGFTVDAGDIENVEITIGDGFVGVFVDMPVEVSKGDADTDMNKFYSKIPLDLKRYYEVANNIMVLEKNISFMEKQSLDLLQIYSGVDVSKLPPTSGATFEFVPTVLWNTQEVEQNIKQQIASKVSLLQFAGTNNFYRHQYPVSSLTPLYQKTYDNMILPLEDATDLDVRFDYNGWDPYVRVNDENGVIKPNSVVTHYWLLHFGMQEYNTIYDVSYPTLVTIHDEQALDGDGYSFSIALEANIRGNRPAEHDQAVVTKLAALTPTMVCDPSKYDTQPLKTIVVDSFSGEPVPAVQIGLTIPDQSDCVIGITDTEGEFESTYPAVYGGVLSLIKEGYLTTFYPIDTYRFKDQPAVIGAAIGLEEPQFEAYPFKDINIKVTKRSIGKCIDSKCSFSNLFRPSPNNEVYSFIPQYRERDTDFGRLARKQLLDSSGRVINQVDPEDDEEVHAWYYTGARQELELYEKATITLTRVGDLQEGTYSEEFTALASIEGDGATRQTMRLVPGIYTVSGTLISQQELIIPSEERCSSGIAQAISCLDLDGCCFEIPETIMKTSIPGQLQWDIPEMYITITPEQVYGSEEIEFFIPAIDMDSVSPSDRVSEDMQVTGEMARISQDLYSQLQPRFT